MSDMSLHVMLLCCGQKKPSSLVENCSTRISPQTCVYACFASFWIPVHSEGSFRLGSVQVLHQKSQDLRAGVSVAFVANLMVCIFYLCNVH